MSAILEQRRREQEQAGPTVEQLRQAQVAPLVAPTVELLQLREVDLLLLLMEHLLWRLYIYSDGLFAVEDAAAPSRHPL